MCTGNICRSPTAERLARSYAAAYNISGLKASSAGTRAVVGYPIHPDAALVLETLGGDPAGFAARRITPKVAAEADLILTMTREHRDTVFEVAPRQFRRTFTLAEAALLAAEFNARNVADLANLRLELTAHAVADIPDPIGRDHEFFEVVGAQIAELLLPVLQLGIDPG